MTEAHNGIQNRSRRVRKRLPADHRERRSNPAAAAQKSCPVALVLQIAVRLPLDRGQMGEPDLGLDCRTRSPCGQQGPELGDELRFYEQVRECGVGLVRALRSQHDLGIGRDIDLTVIVLEIGHRQPAKLGVVLGGNHDLQGDRKGAMPLHDLGPVFGIHDFVGFRFGSAGLESSGPDVTGLRVPQEEERAPAVPRCVLPPAGDGKVPPAAEPGARRRDHDRVAAVGKEMSAGSDVVRRFEPPQGGG